MEPEGSLPYSQVPATFPYPEPARSSPYPKSHVSFPFLRSHQTFSPCLRHQFMFRNIIHFYGENLLAPRPTPKLENHPLSAFRDCLFNIFAATLHIGGHSSIRNLKTPFHDDMDPIIMGTLSLDGRESSNPRPTGFAPRFVN
jgi:hypothetical protein